VEGSRSWCRVYSWEKIGAEKVRRLQGFYFSFFFSPFPFFRLTQNNKGFPLRHVFTWAQGDGPTQKYHVGGGLEKKPFFIIFFLSFSDPSR
jgi:hypothetical protein